jgi:hypothetical protein
MKKEKIMTRIREIKTTFTAGEVSRDLLGRGDLRAYENGALALRNVFINPTGGVTRRAGLAYIDTAAGNGKLIAFEFSTEQYVRELDTLYLGRRKLVSASAFWDPSFGSVKGDRSVLAVIYADAEGSYFLHHLAYIRAEKDGEVDEATQQCRQVAQIARDLRLPYVAVEANGIGKFLPGILRNEMVLAHAPCSVQELTQVRSKDLRILDAFDSLLAARKLYVSRNVMKTPFLMEMQEWRPGLSRGHDDGLDAVAGAIDRLPSRMSRLYGSGAHTWGRGVQEHEAKTDFMV